MRPYVADIYRDKAAKYVARKVVNGQLRCSGKRYKFWRSDNHNGTFVYVVLTRHGTPLYVVLASNWSLTECRKEHCLALSEVE